MNSILRNALQKLGLRESLKTGTAYSTYMYLFHHRQWKHNDRMKRFYTQLVRSVPKTDWGIEQCMIFDIGANQGDTTDYFRFAADQVLCIEPDHRSADRLRERFSGLSNVRVKEGAVDDMSGYSILHVDPDHPAFNTLSSRWKRHVEETLEHRFEQSYVVETWTLDELIDRYGLPVYIKLDVEGSELHALNGLSRAVPYISFEANLEVFREEASHCVRRISSLSPETDFMYSFSEGFRHDLSAWISPDSMSDVLRRTESPFVEIMARLQRIDPRSGEQELARELVPEGELMS